MAVFTYEYREQTGAIRSECVEASTRAEAIAKAKSLGRNVLRMREGAQGRKGGVPSNRVKSKKLCIALGLGALLVLALAIMLFIGLGKDRAEPTPPVVKTSPKVREHKEKATTNALPQKVAVTTNKTVKVLPPTGKGEVSASTNAPKKKLDWATLTNDPNVIVVPRKEQVFHTTTEQVLNFIFNAPVGGLPPPLPTLPGYEMENLEKILDAKNVVGPDDSPEVIERKEMVERAKKELKDYLAQGGDAGQFLKFYHDELKKAYSHKMTVQKQVMEVIRQEPEIAHDFIKKVNDDLAKMGITPVKIPRQVMERHGLKVEEENKER